MAPPAQRRQSGSGDGRETPLRELKPEPAIKAVPEPGVWALMVAGLAFVRTTQLGGIYNSSQRHVAIPSFVLLEGANTFVFDYCPMRGFGDEAWGLDSHRGTP